MAKRPRGPAADEFNSLPPAAASRYLGVSRQTIYTWLGDGTLRAHQLGVHKRILRVDLDRLKETRAERR